MKIWKEFNSSHSNNITIVGKFDSEQYAKEALDITTDIALSSWEERHPNLESFIKKWESSVDHIRYTSHLGEIDMVSGIDNEPDISLSGKVIKIEGFRNTNFGGIVKVLRMMGARTITVEEVE